MKSTYRLLILSLLFIQSCQKAEQAADSIFADKHENQSAIVGKTMSLKKPEAGSILYIHNQQGNTYFMCAGTLIHPRVILTAAHCLLHNVETYKIYRTSEYDSNHAPASLEISHFIVHPEFSSVVTENSKNPNTAKTVTTNDIALIVLKKPAKNMTPALMLSSNELEKPAQKFFALGYGATRLTKSGLGNDPTRLRFRELQILSRATNGKLFHVDQREGGICKGDSGGPALVPYKGSYAVVGVAKNISLDYAGVAAGSKLSDNYCKRWSTFTSVSHYYDWITKELLDPRLTM